MFKLMYHEYGGKHLSISPSVLTFLGDIIKPEYDSFIGKHGADTSGEILAENPHAIHLLIQNHNRAIWW